MQIGGIKHFIAPLCGRPIPKPGSTPVIVACVLEPQLRAVDWSESIGCATSSRNTSSKGLQKFLAREALGCECIRVFRAFARWSKHMDAPGQRQLPSTAVLRAIRLPGIRQYGSL